MLLAQFNSLTSQDAEHFLKPFLDIPRWGEEIIRARPYPSKEALLDRAGAAAGPFAGTEVAQAMSHHPRIGEQARGPRAEAVHSRAEQAEIDPTDADLGAVLFAGNRVYEDRFDRVFVIRAAGRSPTEIIEHLHARLGNDPETEDEIVERELREIAVLRLDGAISS